MVLLVLVGLDINIPNNDKALNGKFFMNDLLIVFLLFGMVAGFVFTVMLPAARESCNSKFQIVIPIMSLISLLIGAIGSTAGSGVPLLTFIFLGVAIWPSVVLYLNIKEMVKDKSVELSAKSLANEIKVKKIKREIASIKTLQNKILDLYDQLNSNDFNVEYATKIFVSTKDEIITVKKDNK